MKPLLLLLVLLFPISICFGEFVTIYATVPAEGGRGYSAETIELAPGEIATVLSCFSSVHAHYPVIAVELGGVELVLQAFVPTGNTAPAVAGPWAIAGPATIRATINGSTNQAGKLAFITLDIDRIGDSAGIMSPNIAVIPNDATGNFNVILESSVDLINWNPANPGLYSSSISNRFFRFRIERL